VTDKNSKFKIVTFSENRNRMIIFHIVLYLYGDIYVSYTYSGMYVGYGTVAGVLLPSWAFRARLQLFKYKYFLLEIFVVHYVELG
jgi:hypothetical protein